MRDSVTRPFFEAAQNLTGRAADGSLARGKMYRQEADCSVRRREGRHYFESCANRLLKKLDVNAIESIVIIRGLRTIVSIV
jgi:hypothetical protein